jgi:Putative collagen-binding domain of a collagenase
MAGGSGCEWYFGYRYANNDLNCEDFRSREEMYRQTRIAAEFFQEHLPVTEMVSADDLLTDDDCWCFAQPGDVYAVYLPPGHRTRIRLPQASFRVQWFNPRSGGGLQEGSLAEVEGGDAVSPGEPPSDPDQDWVVIIRRMN